MLQPPVKFHDVVPNGKPETKRDNSKTEAPFLLEIPCLYMMHRPMKLHAMRVWMGGGGGLVFTIH